MTYPHAFTPIAMVEYEEAVGWYLERSSRAAENFVKGISRQIATICNDPLRYRNTYKEFRETSLRKYPYSIVYSLDEQKKQVVIFSIFHQKRSLRKKFRKK